ncbi:MAG: hypothetical protein LBQ66_13580, partial [Planctomycetaceae bacterium]|nr:hypothetical protein [Planctomycetaceae bacterium]
GLPSSQRCGNRVDIPSFLPVEIPKHFTPLRGRWQASPLQYTTVQQAISYLLCQLFLAFRSNFFGFPMHLGGRDARVPVLYRFAAIILSTDLADLAD